MTFPDQLRMDHVTEALWDTAGAGASVIVGSGFSRNARPKGPKGSPMPMLEDIAARLGQELYPQDPDRREPPERLAQEYAVECGETKLHQILQRTIADLDYRPGAFHRRLLQMPWRDIFTTNWDTLLERARGQVPERAYSVVRARSDLPQHSRPRIVKLHGSLPDPPLILTEDSYRTYPRTHAPFVNTVQQAMMTTLVLLLGFSGDDPNFLHWSGWVRDNLGEAAPKIYLAGYLGMSRSRRQMLESVRNVIPIDLARHPRIGRWPEPLRHQLATEWILTSLECGKPYVQTRWPEPPPTPKRINPLIDPVAMRHSTCPVAEPSMNPPQEESIEADKRKVARAVDAWRQNRKCYPGWLVFPQSKRSTQRRAVEHWTPFILRVLPRLEWLERLDVIFEVLWRFEKSLARPPKALETAAAEVLDAIDCETRAVGTEDVSEAKWTRIRAKWSEVALSLLTAARYRLDADGLEDRLERLAPCMSDDLEVAQRIHHERCLWSLWELDYKRLEQLLDRWNPSDVDPMWKLRKSALLRDLGRDQEAATLVEEAMVEIRAAPRSGQDFTTVAREGWALWSTISLNNLTDFRERWRHLAPMQCDAPDVWDLRNALEQGNSNAKATPGFDLGVQRSGGRWYRFDSERFAAAYESVRLTEVAGLPNAVDSFDVAGSLLRLSAERLAAVDPQLAIRLVLRAASGGTDEFLQRVLSRERTAALPRRKARRLCDAVKRLALHAISRVEANVRGERIPWARRAGVALEGWSRLILRVDHEEAERALQEGLKLHARSMHFWLHESLGNLLRRSWETMRSRNAEEVVLDILETQIPRDREMDVVSKHPEPADLLWDLERPPERTPENETRWVRVIGTLVRAATQGGVTRERASRRLGRIADWGLLTPPEVAQVAEGWWGTDAPGDGSLPVGTGLPDYVFVVLPEPRQGMGRRAFGRKWLTGDSSQAILSGMDGSGAVGLPVTHMDPHRADDVLHQAGHAVAFLRHHSQSLALSSSEKTFVTGIVDQWTKTSVRFPKDIPDFFVAPVRQSLAGAIRGLGFLLSEVRVPASLAQALNQKVKDLHDAQLDEKGIPAFGMLPGIWRSAPELLDDIDVTMKKGLASDDVRMANSAFGALRIWLEPRSDESPPSPLEQWVREVGVAVAVRRQAAGAALDVAKWIFEQGRTDHRDVIRDLVVTGMGYLLEQLRYDRETAGTDGLDIPLTRWRCVRVARAIAAERSDAPDIVRRWLELGKGDPLPEVRHVATDWRSDGRVAE